jgi:5'-nucleotidase
VLKRRPDLLLSGINHGANNSINVIYSGTMSAAVEGAVEGIPSIGFSLLDHSWEADFSAAKNVVRTMVHNVLQHGMPTGTCLNVNIPAVPEDDIRGIRICRQAKAWWEDEFDMRTDPGGKTYYWITGQLHNEDHGEDTDIWALQHNFVSVVPVQYDLTAYHAMAVLNSWNYEAQ